MKELTISQDNENQRLDKYLMKYFNNASKSFIYKMLRKKRIKYNGKRAVGSEIIKSGDTLQMYISDETIDNFKYEKIINKAERHFDIVYEDNDIIIVSKPAGLLSHPEKSSDNNTLIDQIIYYLYEKGEYNQSSTFALCNRLDRNTSGIVIAGKNFKAVQSLNEEIKSHKLDKFYITMVSGHIDKDGEIIGYILKNSISNEVKVFDTPVLGSKKVVTKYKVIKATNKYSLLEVNLVTGKSHQIRASLKSKGYFIIGDRKYGDINVNKFFKEKYGLSNQFLHAYKLSWKKDSKYCYLNNNIYSPLPKPFNIICKDIFKLSL